MLVTLGGAVCNRSLNPLHRLKSRPAPTRLVISFGIKCMQPRDLSGYIAAQFSRRQHFALASPSQNPALDFCQVRKAKRDFHSAVAAPALLLARMPFPLQD